MHIARIHCYHYIERCHKLYLGSDAAIEPEVGHYDVGFRGELRQAPGFIARSAEP